MLGLENSNYLIFKGVKQSQWGLKAKMNLQSSTQEHYNIFMCDMFLELSREKN